MHFSQQRHTEASEQLRQELQSKDEKHQCQLNDILSQFQIRDAKLWEEKVQSDTQMREEKILFDIKQRERDAAISSAREAESAEYKTNIDLLIKQADKTTLTLLDQMKLMMSVASAQSATIAPSRPATTAPESLPSQINVDDTEMEETSQITSALSGTQGLKVNSKSDLFETMPPPRIGMKWTAQDTFSSSTTGKTMESTKASSDSEGHDSRTDGLVTQEPFKEGKDENDKEQRETAFPIFEDLEPRMLQDHEETPPFPGTAPYAEALPKSSNHHADCKQRPIQQEEVMGKSASEMPVASIHQDHEENPAFSGTAPYAEALPKSSNHHADRKQRPIQQEEVMGKSASEMPVASIHQDHEENPAFSGTAPYAEALAKSSNHHADQKQRLSQQGEVTGKSASETTGASIHQDHEENPAFSGTAPYAEALAKSSNHHADRKQ
jgi:hypothetical protein